MCGIAGIYNYGSGERADRGLLQRMNDLLAHRGPDDEGFFVEGPIGLAMRRLAIIDVPSGRQPMSNEDGSVHLVFNGEIYNFQILRQELAARGVRFMTNSDTEVILRLYETDGIDCVKRLRGMFAFAVWDGPRQRLMIARDRFGKKPLVYVHSNGRFAWASEIRSLLEMPDVSKDIDPEAVDMYLGLQYIPSPLTIFKSVRKLPPAHVLVIEKGRTRIERYWALSTEPSSARCSVEEAKHMIREEFEESTRLRMVSDVPLGAFLSGGIDSTLVVGMMSRLSPRPVKTFAIGFEEDEYSELPYAREAARFFKTDHTEFIVKPQMADILPKLAWHYGEPFGDSSALPSYYLARETRKHVTVALTGDGGDEAFGGYNRYAAMKLAGQLDWAPLSLRRSLSALGKFFPRKGRRFLQDVLAAPAAARYFNLVGIFSEQDKNNIYAPGFLGQLAGLSRSINYLNSFFEQSKRLDLVNQMLYVDLASYLPECLMAKADIATMANSLEARSPFLDHELIERVFALSGDWKIKGMRSTKWILKESLRDLLPGSIAHRSKMGFGIPVAAWFRGELKNFWRDHALSAAALSRGYFKAGALERIFDEHVSGRRDHGYRMWVLLMLELWHQAYLPGGKVSL